MQSIFYHCIKTIISVNALIMINFSAWSQQVFITTKLTKITDKNKNKIFKK